MKLFFEYSELNDDPTSPTYYLNNSDAQNKTGISQGKPSYYIFSFYTVLVEKTFTELDDLTQWVNNASRTVIPFFIFIINLFKRLLISVSTPLNQIL